MLFLHFHFHLSDMVSMNVWAARSYRIHAMVSKTYLLFILNRISNEDYDDVGPCYEALFVSCSCVLVFCSCMSYVDVFWLLIRDKMRKCTMRIWSILLFYRSYEVISWKEDKSCLITMWTTDQIQYKVWYIFITSVPAAKVIICIRFA